MSTEERPPAPTPSSSPARPFWRSPLGLGAAAAALVVILYLASQAQAPGGANPPEQPPQTEQGRSGQPDQTGNGADTPVADGSGVAAQPPNTDPAFDMDAWRRKEEADAEEQRRRVAVPREEERCQNEDGTVDTRSIHGGGCS